MMAVAGPRLLGITWTVLASFAVQMVVGILVVDAGAMLTLLFAWRSVCGKSGQGRSQRVPAPHPLAAAQR
jgi:hypothetical protein